MAVEKLSKIFDSATRVKMMRMFLFNEKTPFDIKDIVTRTKSEMIIVRREIKILSEVGFIGKKTFIKIAIPVPASTKKGVTKKAKALTKKKVTGYILNNAFPLIDPLKMLLIHSELTRSKDIPKRLASAGSIKMLVLSGIFMKDDERSLDMVIVGDKVDMKKLHKSMETLESEVGKELRYSVFTPAEFQYRLEMYDQHLLDIFKYPHERVVDKLGLIL